jgi:CelD/BcsL family acetyltransferase involved in cellulose biosynthesis
MAALLRETMNRTGGLYQPEDWKSWIAFGNAHPELSHLIGTFREGIQGADALVAFVWGSNHGDHVELRTAASTRLADSRASLTHPLIWELIRWARRARARWFDLGGVTAGNHESNDRRGGISDFKRSFCTHEVTVGEEWALEPNRLRARVARAVSWAAAWLASALERARSARPSPALSRSRASDPASSGP